MMMETGQRRRAATTTTTTPSLPPLLSLSFSSVAVYFSLLMTSSSLLLFGTALGESSLPCPSPCRCFQENFQPYGDVNTIQCTGKSLKAVPDLSELSKSPIPNNLELDQNQIGEISKKDFPPGVKIVVLNLNQNIGMNISDDAFLNLGISLKELSLEAVDMVYDKTLTVFDSLFSLEKLALNHNNKHPYTEGAVQDVTATLFKGEVAKHLKNLKMAYCAMRTMSENSLSKLVSLEELDISNNWFVSIPPAIKPLKSLRFVEFFYCNVLALKDYDFSGLPNLDRIDLSSNGKLATIESKAFSGCENSLKQLNLQRCSLNKIPTEALKNLKKLTFLDISENDLEDVGANAFEGDYKLKELVISSPQLNFDLDIFKGQEANIADLSIPSMNLKTIPLEPLQKLTNLKRLSLEYNNITALPAKAFKDITASSIRLDNNPLSSIAPGAFEDLPPSLVISLRRTKMADIDFLVGYSDQTIDTVNIEHSSLVCRCSMKSAINVTQHMHLYGSCASEEKSIHISSNKLGGILDQACEDEKRNNSGNNIMLDTIVAVVSLGFAIAVTGMGAIGK